MKSKLNIERAFARLNDIVILIESDNISIDEMIELYDEGADLFKFCKDKISKAENKVKIISKKYK